MNVIFKQCSYCHHLWRTREDLVRDPEVELIGFQAFFDEPENGLFLFTHTAARCRTTIAVRAGEFTDYAQHNVEERAGAMVCPGHCLERNNLESCGEACDLHWVRGAMQSLRTHTVPSTAATPRRRSA